MLPKYGPQHSKVGLLIITWTPSASKQYHIEQCCFHMQTAQIISSTNVKPLRGCNYVEGPAVDYGGCGGCSACIASKCLVLAARGCGPH